MAPDTAGMSSDDFDDMDELCGLKPTRTAPATAPNGDQDRVTDSAADWWVTTGRKQDNGKRVLGPFDTRELALEVRTLAESAWDREGAFWVVTGHEIPERSITPGFFRTRATA